MNNKPPLGKILLVLIAVIVIVNIGIYYYFYGKIKIANSEKETALKDLDSINQEKNKLNLDIEKIQHEITLKTQAIDKENNDYDKFVSSIKDYTTSQKTILQDIDSLDSTIYDFDLSYTSYQRSMNTILVFDYPKAYSELKTIYARYNLQLDTLKSHIKKYQNTILQNKVLFQNVGIETDKENKRFDEVVNFYEDFKNKMNEKTQQFNK